MRSVVEWLWVWDIEEKWAYMCCIKKNRPISNNSENEDISNLKEQKESIHASTKYLDKADWFA